MALHHLAALAASSPAHVSNLKYATESWTPGGTALGVIILAVLILAWMKIRVRRPVPAPAPARSRARDRTPARR